MKFIYILILVAFNICYSSDFNVDSWLEKITPKIRSSSIISDWKAEYGTIYIEPSYNSKEAIISVYIEVADDLFKLQPGGIYKYYGVNNFRQLDLEKKFSAIWYLMKLEKVFVNGQTTTIPINQIKCVQFIMDSRGMEIIDIDKMPEMRKEVKKKVFEYKPIEGKGETEIFGLEPLKEYEKIFIEKRNYALHIEI